MKAFVIYLILCFIGSGIANMNTGTGSTAAADEPVCENVYVAEEYCEAKESYAVDTSYDPVEEDMSVEADEDKDDEPANDSGQDDIRTTVAPAQSVEAPVTVVSDPASDEDAECDDDCDENDEDWEDDQDREDDQEDDRDDDQEDDRDESFRKPEESDDTDIPEDIFPVYPDPLKPMYVPNEVIFLADSEEEAQGVADEYGLTLKSFSYGVAVLDTGDKDACEIVSYGRENGLTPVDLNHIIYLDDPVERFRPDPWELQPEVRIVSEADTEDE